jgi:hypothetical protein
MSNPPMADGQPLFSAAHRSLMPASALTADSLAAAAAALTPIVEPRITDRSWYVTASPTEAATIITAQLSGQSGPVLQARAGWSVDPREYKGREDFGAAVADWRGLVKTPPAP